MKSKRNRDKSGNIRLPACRDACESDTRGPMDNPVVTNNAANNSRRNPLGLAELPRVLPFVLFLVIGAAEGRYFPGSQYWLYVAKTVVSGALLYYWRGLISEMRWAFSVSGLLSGLVIAALWIGLDGVIPSLDAIWYAARKLVTGQAAPPVTPDALWNPITYFVGQPALGWGFVAIRVLGRSLVVPAMEEVFYRSFFYRYIANPKFLEMPIGVWHSVAFLVTCAAFSFSHPGQWLAALICAATYQWLVIRHKRLGDAMLAHGVTNLVISIWAITTGQWKFT